MLGLQILVSLSLLFSHASCSAITSAAELPHSAPAAANVAHSAPVAADIPRAVPPQEAVDHVGAITQLIFRPHELVHQVVDEPRLARFHLEQPSLYQHMMLTGMRITEGLRDAGEVLHPKIFYSLDFFRHEWLAKASEGRAKPEVLNVLQHSFYSRLRDLQSRYPDVFDQKAKVVRQLLLDQFHLALEIDRLKLSKPFGTSAEVQAAYHNLQAVQEQLVAHQKAVRDAIQTRIPSEKPKYLPEADVEQILVNHGYKPAPHPQTSSPVTSDSPEGHRVTSAQSTKSAVTPTKIDLPQQQQAGKAPMVAAAA